MSKSRRPDAAALAPAAAGPRVPGPDTAVLPVATVGCGCGCGTTASAGDGAGAPVDEARAAVAVDPAIKARSRTRLRRIEGQVRGIQQMVENERYCADVLVQISAVQEALRAVSRELMRNHLKHCASAAIRGTPERAGAMYDELADLFYKHAR